MKTILSSAVMVLCLLGGSAFAGTEDMKTGTFYGKFCGMDATFELTRRADWTFYGRIHIHATQEYDQLRITQYADNSLRITRTVSGAGSLLQRVETGKPGIRRDNSGRVYAFYQATGSYRNDHGCGRSARTTISVY